MENTKSKVAETTITRELANLAKDTGNIYETVAIIAKRANQISLDVKKEINAKLEEFSHFTDTLEETFENREQIEISKYYERLPKPTAVAIKEFEDKDIYYKLTDQEA